MERRSDWVLYPFKAASTDSVILFRINGGFELRFTRDIFSKRANTTPVDLSRTTLEIEITDGRGEIVSQITRLHKFDTPADFYVGIPEKSKEFYESIHAALIGSDLDDLMSKAIEAHKHAREAGFPEIPLPAVTACSHFENFQSASAVVKGDGYPRISVERARYGDPAPEACSASSIETHRKYFTEEQFKVQETFYREFFDANPISRCRGVYEEYEKRDSNFKQVISFNLLKRCISLHAYFIVSGPWRKCWARFGFNPSEHQYCYKYQLIEMRSKRANFMIYQKPEIMAEISKNKSWYLREQCDPCDGFVSQALKNLITYTLDNAGVKEIDKKIDEMLDSDFELFEM